MSGFLIDECVSIQTKLFLDSLRFETVDSKEVGLIGTDDAGVFRYAKENGYVLVTYDKGFGDIRKYPPSSHNGIIILKIRNQISMERCHKVLEFLLGMEKELRGALYIVDEKKYRKRKSP